MYLLHFKNFQGVSNLHFKVNQLTSNIRFSKCLSFISVKTCRGLVMPASRKNLLIKTVHADKMVLFFDMIWSFQNIM